MTTRKYRPSADVLESLPTIAQCQAHDLKLEQEICGVPTRWYLSRCTADDGETHRVYVEQIRDGRWVQIDRYAPCDGGRWAGNDDA